MSERGGQPRGRPFVVAAPSGTGKTTVCRAAMEHDSKLRFSISHTTRAPRPGERDGVDYHFVDSERFRQLVQADAFIEYAEYNGNLYGTSWEALEEPTAAGWDLIVEIEVKGARLLRDRRRDACFVFLLPPTMDDLRDRLRKRGTDSDEAIAKRLAIAEQELEAVEFFDYAIVNREVGQAVSDLLEIVVAEREGRTGEARARHAREVVLQKWRAAADH